MGKTVESFRIALEGEINRWSGFASLCLGINGKFLLGSAGFLTLSIQVSSPRHHGEQ